MKKGIQKLLTDGTIVEILQAQIKATNVQTKNSLEGNRVATPLNEASASIHPQVNRGKGVFFILMYNLMMMMMMSIIELLKHHNCELLRLLT